ncbi:MAG: hypothetical protein Q9200_001723 [Gallowayella weberi]
MAKSCKKPRAKKAQPLQKDTTKKVKESRIIKPTSKTPKQTFSTPSKHGMKTRARQAEAMKIPAKDQEQQSPCSSLKKKPQQVSDAYYTSLSQEFQKTPKRSRTSRNGRKSLKTPQTPKTPKTPKSSGSVQTPVFTSKSLRDLLSPYRSFWDPIKESNSSQGSPSRAFADDDLRKIFKRLNNGIRYQMTNKVENYGFLLSSSPSGHDPREEAPVTDDEVAELQVALWPSIQQLVELTKRYPHHSDTKKCYLDQFRALHNQLQYTWQLQNPLSSAPTLFQLEPWKGGIVNWRSSTYCNGDDRFAASIVLNHLEIWRAEIPSPSSPLLYPKLHLPDIDESDLEMSPLPRRPPYHTDTDPSSSPLPDRSSPQYGHRRIMSALYDRDRDIGFRPTAAQIQAYQAGDPSTTALPFASMSEDGLPIDSSSDPWTEYHHIQHTRTRIPIFDSENITSAADDDAGWIGYTGSQGSVSSNKENDVQAMERVMEALRRENEPDAEADEWAE